MESLHDIGVKCKTDKANRHQYLNIYEKYLSEYRDKPLRMLEIGYKDGHSANMWEKYFTNDLGIRGLFYSNEADVGQALENIVYLQLLRQGYRVYVGEFADQEIDFIAEKGGDKQYIQVAYLLANDDTINREFSALENIQDNYPKYVLSMDKIKMERNGIKHLNIIDFLLGENNL